jgi:hypothetical protein
MCVLDGMIVFWLFRALGFNLYGAIAPDLYRVGGAVAIFNRQYYFGASVRRDSDKLFVTSAQVECGARGTSCLCGPFACLSTVFSASLNLIAPANLTVRTQCSLA